MGIHGQDQYLRLGQMLSNSFGSLDTVHAGHGDVHNHHIGFQLFGFINGMPAVGSFSDDLQVGLFLQKARQTLPYNRMVVR